MHSAHFSESIYNQFINQIKDYAIFAMDTQGFIITWNVGAERLKGYTEAEIIGQFYGILSLDDYQKEGKPQQELELALKNGSFEAEDWRKRKDGSLFWATLTLTPIFSPEGEHIGFTKVTGDITKQKELQEELARRQHDALFLKNAELEKTNIDLDNFIYTASHDLKSPITNIEGLVEFLRQDLIDKSKLDATSANILAHISSSINRFKNTVNDLTEISKLQKNINGSSTEEVLHVPQIYEQIIAESGFLYTNKPCEMQTDFQVQVFKYSKKNFRSVFYNLLSNAFKFQSPHRPCVIQLKTHQEGPHVVLSVKDNGLGIKDKNKEQLFTMFKRFHNHVEGTGIGLYMIKRIVENAGGKIEVASEEGTGTEFKVYFKVS